MAIASAGFLLNDHLGLGDLRRRTGAAQHFFEKARAAAAGLFELRRAQRLAAFKKRRLLFQHLVEQRDGVIQCFPAAPPRLALVNSSRASREISLMFFSAMNISV